ncbi:MAG: AMP-binding protein, partial [Candidatus Omnitrophica bacterium]|nr:AMP-binding protein [Candidatus Omnitrophota bacterium]
AERPFLTYEDQDISYAQVLDAIKRLAAKLLELVPGNSSEPENHIALFAPNLPGFVIGFYGTLAANKTTVPINFLLNPNEIMTIGMHAGIRIVLASGPLYEKAVEMSRAVPITVLRIEDFFAPGPVPELPAVSRGDDDTAVLMYTSGTTGMPKGVELTHTNIHDNYSNVVGAWPFHEGNTFIGVIPLFHSFAMTALLVLSGYIGARLVLLPQFMPQKLIEYFLKYPDCIFFAVPPMFKVLGQIALSKGLKFPNLKLCVSGAAALPMDVKEIFEKGTGVDLFQGYGLTEASPAVSFNLPGAHKPGTIGRPIPHVRVEIWDDEGKPLPTGQVGELVVFGKNVMRGYYKNPQATAQAINPDGGLHTGDLAKIDEEGFISIAGRKKELIICAGENIYPTEIEHVLGAHPGVADAAVIGIPHPTKGEEPKAFVAPVPGATLDPAELKQLCKEKLAAFKVPAEIEIRESLPKNPTGKVLKRVLEAEIGKA